MCNTESNGDCQYPPAKMDDTRRGGAAEPLRTTRAEKVTRQTMVGVVAQKKTHQASTYLSVLSADTFRYMDGWWGWVGVVLFVQHIVTLTVRIPSVTWEGGGDGWES